MRPPAAEWQDGPDRLLLNMAGMLSVFHQPVIGRRFTRGHISHSDPFSCRPNQPGALKVDDESRVSTRREDTRSP